MPLHKSCRIRGGCSSAPSLMNGKLREKNKITMQPSTRWQIIWNIAWGYKSPPFHRNSKAVLCQRNMPLNKSISNTKPPLPIRTPQSKQAEARQSVWLSSLETKATKFSDIFLLFLTWGSLGKNPLLMFISAIVFYLISGHLPHARFNPTVWVKAIIEITWLITRLLLSGNIKVSWMIKSR